MDEVTEHLEAISLLNRLLLEELSHHSDSLSYVLKLSLLLLDLILQFLKLSLIELGLIESWLSTGVSLLDLLSRSSLSEHCDFLLEDGYLVG